MDVVLFSRSGEWTRRSRIKRAPGRESNPRHVAQGTDEPATPKLDPYVDVDYPRSSTALPLSYPVTKNVFSPGCRPHQRGMDEAKPKSEDSAHPHAEGGNFTSGAIAERLHKRPKGATSPQGGTWFCEDVKKSPWLLSEELLRLPRRGNRKSVK